MDPTLLILLVVFMGGMIFMSSRARRKQQTQQESLQNSLGVGDVVVMSSGISGTIVDTDDERTIDLEIAPDVVTTWLRASVREKLSAFGAETDEESDVLAADAELPVLDEPVTEAGTHGSTESTPGARIAEPSDAVDRTEDQGDGVGATGPSLKKSGS